MCDQSDKVLELIWDMDLACASYALMLPLSLVLSKIEDLDYELFLTTFKKMYEDTKAGRTYIGHEVSNEVPQD